MATYGAVALAVSAAIAVYVAHRTTTTAAERAVRADAELLADRLARDDLAGQSLGRPVGADVRPQLDELFDGAALAADAAGVSLVSRTGTVTYATKRSLIGRRFDREQLRTALNGGGHAAAGDGDAKVMRAFVPVRWIQSAPSFAGGVLVLERPYAPIAAAVQRDFAVQAGVVGLALMLFYFLSFPIMRRISRALEARHRLLVEHARTDAVAGLARGVAHDFNNLLTGVAMYSDLLLDRLRPDDPARREAEEIRNAAVRGAALTRHLLAFSEERPQEIECLDANEVIRSTEKLLVRVIGEDVAVATDLSAEPLHVAADRAQLEGILVNLVLAARHTIGRGGTITVRSRPGDANVVAVEATTPARAAAAYGGFALESAAAAVCALGGTFDVQPVGREGVRFAASFPAAPAPTQDAVRPAEPSAPFRQATILLVEDEEIVRAVTREILEGCGHTVVCARDGRQALEAAAEQADAVDLLITDLVMPGMGGRELAERLVSERPSLAVLYTSGYPDEAVAQTTDTARSAFLQKPFAHAELARTVARLLSAPPAPALAAATA